MKSHRGGEGVLSEDFCIGSRPLDLKFGCIFGTIWGVFKNAETLDVTLIDSGLLGMDPRADLLDNSVP